MYHLHLLTLLRKFRLLVRHSTISSLQEDYYLAYEEISTDIGLVEKSNGYRSIIIEKAFYDGNTVTLSYVLRTEEDLGSHFQKLLRICQLI